jgi:hypothetical protein
MVSRKNVQFPCAAEIKATGELVSAIRAHVVAGIPVYELHTKRGKLIGDYAQSRVILRPTQGLG